MTLRTKHGFTLIEVLLVCLILGFVAAIATPAFIHSMKGQRLRQATRLMMGTGRYARTLAVLRQRPVKLILTVGGTRIAVEEGPAPASSSAPVYTREQLESLTNSTPLPAEAPPVEPPPSSGSGQTAAGLRNVSSDLEGVRIARLTVHDGLPADAGAVAIVYKSNGTCTPYEVVLADDDGAESVVTVDFLGDPAHDKD